MTCRKASTLLGTTLLLALPATQARAHWCDCLWASSYNLTVRPDSDASPKEVYVQNNMGYQLTNFKLTATTSSGAVTLTAPTTLKVPGTLLPGEKGTWKISGTSPAKIEDITFSVSFGNSGQSKNYPTSGARAVMVVKQDGSLFPAPPPPGLAASIASTSNNQSRPIEFQALADWEDLDLGLDKLLTLYCSGRASWGSTDGVSMTYCKDNASTSCPTSKPSGVGSKYDYQHLWAAGALAIRKASLGSRLPVLRERLKCGVNDGDMGFAGFAMFTLGYLGDDAGARSFAQTQASGSGDVATIAKAALYMMGDTSQKAAVQACVQSSSVFVKVACAGALGIVDKDDAPVTSALIPEVKWNEPDVASEDGKGMYAAHVLEMVAYSRRGWVAKGVGEGVVTFYGETGSSAGGTGGAAGSGGASGSGGSGGSTTTGRDAGRDGMPGTGGTAGSGGTTVGAGGSRGTGGSAGAGGVVGSGGRGGSTTPTSAVGGAGGSGGSSQGPSGSGGADGQGGSVAGGGAGSNNLAGSGGSAGGSSGSNVGESNGSGCQCNLGGRTDAAGLSFLALAALAFLRLRRRRD